MFETSTRTLKILAALTWYTGSIVLLLKGVSLLREADGLGASGMGLWMAAGIGVAVGLLKARFLFVRSGRRNLQRIDALPRPRLWQFLRPGFFPALALMIATGATLSRLAHGHTTALLWVGGLDLALATALGASGLVFWSHARRAP